MESTKYRGDDPVIELPLPARPVNDNRGNTSKTSHCNNTPKNKEACKV